MRIKRYYKLYTKKDILNKVHSMKVCIGINITRALQHILSTYIFTRMDILSCTFLVGTIQSFKRWLFSLSSMINSFRILSRKENMCLSLDLFYVLENNHCLVLIRHVWSIKIYLFQWRGFWCKSNEIDVICYCLSDQLWAWI